MNKNTWLQQEMARWLVDGLLSEQQSQQILARYAGRDSNLARTVFSVIGAVVFGLGVILFSAWNWLSMSHVSKLGVIRDQRWAPLATRLELLNQPQDMRLNPMLSPRLRFSIRNASAALPSVIGVAWIDS